MSANIRDVARRAQVSLGTVSNVLNRPEIVSESTLARVKKAMEELDFNPATGVRQSRSTNSRAIALLVPDISNQFYIEILRGVEDCATKHNYMVLIANHDDSIERENHQFKLFLDQGVRGVLVRPAGDRDESLADVFPNISIVPLMEANSPKQEQCSATVDGAHGGEIAIQHLYDLGHRNIVYVSGPASIPQFSLRGSGAYKKSHALKVNLRSVEVDSPTTRGGDLAAKEILALAQRPSAIFCGNDMLALGVLRTLVKHGVRVPQDMSVIGFDDVDFAASANVPLTTIAQSTYQLGYAAAELLIQECEEIVLHAHQQVIFQPQLVIRQSTTNFIASVQSEPNIA